MPKKIIVSDEAALTSKYGFKGLKAIRAAVDRLIAADASRGIETIWVPLDAGSMGKWRAKRGNTHSFWDAIDNAYKLHNGPDYIVILGGPDVVPHQKLRSPLVGAAADEDGPTLPSDLPYACDAAGGPHIKDYIAPSRVVSRLPDQQGKKPEVAFVIHLLDRASKWSPSGKRSMKHFGLSAEVWKVSTTLSLRALFGGKAVPLTSPAKGPNWSKSQLLPQWHFINCHGAPIDPNYYGEPNDYPVAHEPGAIMGLVRPGVVVAAECCYGAQLYNSNPTTRPGLCLEYLDQGAIGFLGSTNIAYGPADSNASADLLCRFFLESCMGGASTGRALLEARQKFATTAAPLSPVDLKTLGQFLLLGDASQRAVMVTGPRGTGKSMAKASKVPAAHARIRGGLTEQAVLLAHGTDTAQVRPTHAPRSMHERMAKIAESAGYAPIKHAATFAVASAKDLTARSALAKSRPTVTKFHVLQARMPATGAQSRTRALAKGRRTGRDDARAIPKGMVLVGREVAGKVVDIQRLYCHSPAIKRCLLRRRSEDE